MWLMRCLCGKGNPPDEIAERAKCLGSILVPVAVDDHLAIRLSLSLLDHRGVAGLVLLDYGGSLAISVTVEVPPIRTYRHARSCWANSDTHSNLFRACGYCGAYAGRRC
jgi:hypothetical protein